ncbi:inactive hydroxysteroid dehydrogenase-like protein 1 [Pseudophryne corroboree]|uniref:inactive hydroxysteroid dehydrogenase-like protein 1 n=1 Tax=Pseudophryne corroboree TaxID=495146 RepID=UPI003081F4CA
MSVFSAKELVIAVRSVSASLMQEASQFCYNQKETLAMVGAGYIVWKGLKFLRGCYNQVQQICQCLFSNASIIKQYGEWAVVTGATDGIGKAYAEELASHGVNIILLGRNTEKLQNVSEAITAAYGVKTRFIVADFSKGREVFPAIKEALNDVDVGILVNNAGVCYDYPTYFMDVSEDKSMDIINVNITAAVMMVYVVLPGMVQRKRGAIINVASATYYKPVPLMTVYAASKSFLDRFTRALQYEYSSEGIFIQSLTPFFVVSKMVDFSDFFTKKSLLAPLAKEYAHSAVRTIGRSLRTTGHWSHSIQFNFADKLNQNHRNINKETFNCIRPPIIKEGERLVPILNVIRRSTRWIKKGFQPITANMN